MAFKPGQSGNPSGRPRTGHSLAEYIRKLAGENGKVYADILHRIAQDDEKPDHTRITAIGVLMERGFGKPPIDVNLDGKLDTVTTVTHKHG